MIWEGMPTAVFTRPVINVNTIPMPKEALSLSNTNDEGDSVRLISRIFGWAYFFVLTYSPWAWNLRYLVHIASFVYAEYQNH